MDEKDNLSEGTPEQSPETAPAAEVQPAVAPEAAPTQPEAVPAQTEVQPTTASPFAPPTEVTQVQPPVEPAPAAPVAAPPTGVPVGAPVTTQAPSPTAALVCGILAIVLCFIPIVGIVLGIVAIVLAGKYFKQGGTAGAGKAGRICGIIGIVCSGIMIVINIITLVLALSALDEYDTTSSYTPSTYSSSSSSSSSSLYASDVDEATEAEVEALVNARLDQIKNHDPQMMASLGAIAEKSFNDTFETYDMTMESCGITPSAYIELMTQNFEYEFYYADWDGDGEDEVEATYMLLMKDTSEMATNFLDLIDEAEDDPSYSTMSEAQLHAEIGRMLMTALDDAGDGDSNYLEVKLTKVNGTWTIDESEWEDEMEYIFGIL